MPRSSMEKYIQAQVKYWQSQKEKIKEPETKSLHQFITISREYGCSGFEIGKEIIETINKTNTLETPWAVYDKQVLDRVMEDMGLSSSLTKSLTDDALNSLTNLLQTSFTKFPPQVAVYRKLAETIRLLAAYGRVVIVGRAGNVITRGMKGGYHVKIIASMDYKASNVMRFKNLSRKDAERVVEENTERRVNYIKEFVNFDVNDPHNYDLIINASKHANAEIANIIIEGIKLKGQL